jgi:hypothetical protein
MSMKRIGIALVVLCLALVATLWWTGWLDRRPAVDPAPSAPALARGG